MCPDARAVTPLPTEELGCEPGDPAAHFLPSDTHEPRITLTRTNLRDDDELVVALPPPRWFPPFSKSHNSPTLDLRQLCHQFPGGAVCTDVTHSLFIPNVARRFQEKSPAQSPHYRDPYPATSRFATTTYRGRSGCDGQSPPNAGIFHRLGTMIRVPAASTAPLSSSPQLSGPSSPSNPYSGQTCMPKLSPESCVLVFSDHLWLSQPSSAQEVRSAHPHAGTR